MSAGIGGIMPFLMMGMNFAGTMMANRQSDAALKAAAQSAQAQIDEYARQAEEARMEAQEDRSDRSRAADKEVAAMFTSMLEGGGLGTVNIARLATDIGAAEGRDWARITRAEKNRVGALRAAANTQVAEYNAYKKQIQFEKQNRWFSALGSGLKIVGGMSSGAYSPTGSTGGTTYSYMRK